ncbi:helix-turn-helix transcriptional regulator [Dyella sp.]|uniref:helix-turn-helix transcriptional regulator n=1 Tax=Dyella sp. TaxID=1869338 RepID=UPI002ED26EED
MSEPLTGGNPVGAYLRARRARLDPAALGYPLSRRRTPGLRREEVAQRANVSATWYTWLEQGRGGAPSADVLDRISRALMLTSVEREHLFLLALGRPPQVRFQTSEDVSPRLQRILDALTLSPAYVKTATWDIVAWNRVATLVLTDYGAIPPQERNILRLLFSHGRVRSAQSNWESIARFAVATFRTDVARVGASEQVRAFVDELCQTYADFARIWRDNDVRNHGEGTKQLQHAVMGNISLEYSAFTVDGRPDLSMVIYNPATQDDRDRVAKLVRDRA